MELVSATVLLIFLLVGISASIQDITRRKVRNYITLPFLSMAMIWFLLSVSIISSELVFLSGLGIILAYLLYQLGVWGGADGKLFIALLLWILPFGLMAFARFILVVFLTYSLVMLYQVVFKTHRGYKWAVFKGLDFPVLLFQSLLIVLLLYSLLRGLGFSLNTYLFFSAALLLKLVFVGFLSFYSGRVFRKMPRYFQWGALSVLVVMFILIGDLVLMGMAVLLFLIRCSVEWTGNLVDCRQGGDTQSSYSPFTPYFFLGAIVAILPHLFG